MPKPGVLELDVADESMLSHDLECLKDRPSEEIAEVVRCSVFFRVICLRPGMAKQVKLPVAAGRRLAKSDICITLHEQTVSGDGCFVCVEPKRTAIGGDPLAILSVEGLDVASIEQGIRIWARHQAPQLFIGSFRGKGFSDLLDSLCRCGAFPDSSKAMLLSELDEQVALLQQLEAAGHVRMYGVSRDQVARALGG